MIYDIYVIMKTMCPSGCHHNGFMAIHALGHMMYGIHLASGFFEIWALCVVDHLWHTINQLQMWWSTMDTYKFPSV